MNAIPMQIMVQIDNQSWTSDKRHAAARLARNNNGTVILVEMIPVGFPVWLGTDMGNTFRQAYPDVKEWKATLEDYGVDYRIEAFQYSSLIEGLAQAAEYFETQLVFAHVPQSQLRFWYQFQQWCLRRRFSHSPCHLYDAGVMQRPASAMDSVPVSNPH